MRTCPFSYPCLSIALASALAGTPTSSQATPRAIELDAALHELEAQSPTLAQARARVEQAAGLTRQALATALPSLSATGGYTRNSDEVIMRLSQLGGNFHDITSQPREVWSTSATLRVPLLAPTSWADAASARSSERAARSSAETVRQQLRAALLQASWNAAADEEIAAASARAVEIAEEQARAAQRALAAGTGVQLAVLQAQTEAVKRQRDLVRARADLEQARLAVGVLLGRDESVVVTLAPLAPLDPLDVSALVRLAFDRRPELRTAAAQLEADDQQARSARLRYLPLLSASGSVFAQDVALPTGKEDGWRVGLELTWALYEGGARGGRVRQAEGQRAEAHAAQAETRIEIEQAVRDAARDVGVAAEQVRLAAEQARLAGEAAATARRGFAGGNASSLDVLDANDRLYQAEIGQAQARSGLGVARAKLDRATGRI